MKKYCYYAGMLAAGMIAFSSCSKDEEIINPNQPGAEDNTPEIVLQVANTGDGLTTKGGRPLTSSDAAQDIDKVKIFVLNSADGAVVLYHEIDNWMSESALYETNGHGRQHTWRLTKEQAAELTGGNTYSVYAVGYTSTGSGYTKFNYGSTSTEISNWPDFDGSTASFNFLNADYEAKTETKDYGEEIFAGEIASIEVNTDKEFVLTNGDENVLTLHRQVTGTIGYFENIPTFPAGNKFTIGDDSDDSHVSAANYKTYVEGLKLRLVVSGLNDMLQMGCFNTNFTETGEDVVYVVNGTTKDAISKDANFVDATGQFDKTTGLPVIDNSNKDSHIVYEISLKDWFKAADVDGDCYLTEDDAQGDNWVTPVGISDDVAYQRGTVFAGKFLIPVAKTPDVRTMQLQLVAGTELKANDGSTQIVSQEKVVRAWNINLPESDPQLKNGTQGRHVSVLKSNADDTPVSLGENATEYEENRTSYSLVRNHLYTVGQISKEDNEPEDLSKGLNLIVKVNDNWEMIHQMEVE